MGWLRVDGRAAASTLHAAGGARARSRAWCALRGVVRGALRGALRGVVRGALRGVVCRCTKLAVMILALEGELHRGSHEPAHAVSIHRPLG
jgi:hypothetical protein